MNKVFPPNALKVKMSTSNKINKKINEKMTETIIKKSTSNQESISKRIEELDREWDTERILETNASIFIIISIILGFLISKLWFFLAALIAFYLLQHAIQGWCPPLPIIRKLGVRTMSEINTEKTVLKVLRGDFENCKSNTVELIKAAE